VTVSDGERRVVVISRNPTMTWGLTIPGCEIDSVRPQHFGEWVTNASDETVDLIVLDVSDSSEAIEGVSLLRANARLAPILLIAGDGEGWDRDDVRNLPGTRMLPLPVDRQLLLLTIGQLLEIDVATDTPALIDAGATSAEPAVAGPPPKMVNMSERRAAIPPTVAEPRVIPVSTSTASAPTADVADDPHAAARLLLRRADRVYGVGETAWAILCDTEEHVRQDAACLMVHDDMDGEWHVVAHRGLAHVERHMRLGADSWWIASVVHGGQAAILTNDRGSSLTTAQAPLSRRKQLLAFAIPGIDALLLIARDDDIAFDETDLDAIVSITEEGGALLADAVDIRRLARALSPLIERPERLAT